MSCLILVIDRTLFDWSLQYNIIFYKDHTYTIGHVIDLSTFCDRSHLIQSVMIVSFDFGVNRTCTISFIFYVKWTCTIDLIIVMSCPHQISHTILLILINQYHILQRSHLYDRSHHCLCLVFIIAHTMSNQSWQFNIIFYLDHICTIDHIIVLSVFHDRPHPIWSIITVHFLFQCWPHLHDMSRRCLIWYLSYTMSVLDRS